jgi:hypothetical protein
MQAKCFLSEEKVHIPLNECTPFVLHIKHRLPPDTNVNKFEDLIEHRLRKMIKNTNDLQKGMLLSVMLCDYLKSNICCAMWKGKPVYVSVIKDS